MKRFLILLCLLLIPSLAFAENLQLARMNPYIAGGVTVSGSSKSCAADSVLWIDKIFTDDYYTVGDTSDRVWVGQRDFDPGTNKVICRVDTNIRNSVGSADYHVEIWSMSGTSLGTILCTSDNVTISSNGTKSFTGLNCSVSGGTLYAITLSRSDDSYDDSNNLGAGVYVATGANMGVSGVFKQWRSDKTQSADITADMSMQIYGYTP